MMHWDASGFGWVGWLVMSLLMLLFWALLIVGGIAVVRGMRKDEPPSREMRRSDDAERLLDERFARGEIDEQDYLHRRELLHTGHSS